MPSYWAHLAVLASLILGNLLLPPSMGEDQLPDAPALLPSEQIPELQAFWEKQEKGVQTVRLKVQKFLRTELHPLSPDDVAQLVDCNDLAQEPEKMRDLENKLLLTPLKVDPPWGIAEFHIEGRKSREESKHSIEVYDGEDPLYHDFGNRTIHIGQTKSGRRSVPSLADLVFRPAPKLLENAHLSRLTESKLVFTWEQKDENSRRTDLLEVDRVTRMPERFQWTIHRPDSDFAKMEVQGGWTVGDDGVYFPRVHTRFDFEGRPLKLRSATITVATEAAINEPIDPAKFKIAVKQGERIMDNRSNQDLDFYAPLDNADAKNVREP